MSIFDYCDAVEAKLKRRDASIKKLRQQSKAKDEAIVSALKNLASAVADITDILEDQAEEDGSFGPYANAAAMAITSIGRAEQALNGAAADNAKIAEIKGRICYQYLLDACERIEQLRREAQE